MKARAHLRNLSVVVAAAGVIAALPPNAEAQRAEATFERTLDVTGPVDLEIVTGSGRIEVRRGVAGRIEVTGRVTANEWWGSGRSRLSADERVRRVAADPPIERTGNGVRIGHIDDEDLRAVSVSYMLVVPEETSLVSRSGSGSHEISGLGRSVDASSGSGSLRIRDIGGDVRASTGSGSIAAESVGGSFRANSGSGSIEGTGIRGGIDARTGSGRIDVSQAGGGDVEASSGSGSITLTGIRGGLRASTSSGTLRVRGEQTSDWRLSTASGSVTIELAGGNPAFALDARSNSGRIETDFPVTMVGTIGRRELRGSVNGGGPLLQVRSSSGGIRIGR